MENNYNAVDTHVGSLHTLDAVQVKPFFICKRETSYQMKALVKHLLRWNYLLQTQGSFISNLPQWETNLKISLLVEALKKKKDWYNKGITGYEVYHKLESQLNRVGSQPQLFLIPLGL